MLSYSINHQVYNWWHGAIWKADQDVAMYESVLVNNTTFFTTLIQFLEEFEKIGIWRRFCVISKKAQSECLERRKVIKTKPSCLILSSSPKLHQHGRKKDLDLDLWWKKKERKKESYEVIKWWGHRKKKKKSQHEETPLDQIWYNLSTKIYNVINRLQPIK